MKNQALIEKLNQIAHVNNSWVEDVKFYDKNQVWLERSAKIAIKVLRTLRENHESNQYPGSQKELAESMNISPQQVNKIVKGSENLTLETIARIEKALGITIFEFKQDNNYEVASSKMTESMPLDY